MTSAGRRALVVGVDGGIGGACAARLAAGGWAVHGVDRGSGIDVTRPGGAEAAVAAGAAALGGLDAIVHAVGTSGRRLGDGPVTACTDQGWADVLRVNLESAFRLLRCGLPALRPTAGAFVAVGSALAHSTDDDFLTAAYAASKAGLVALARVAAREVARDGVRVNVVAAGLTRTPMAARATTDPHVLARMDDLQPLGGPLDAADVAGAVAWLVSDEARRVTGVALPVDAGWSLR